MLKQNIFFLTGLCFFSFTTHAMESAHKRVYSEGALSIEKKLNELGPEKNQGKYQEQDNESACWPKLSEIKDEDVLGEAIFNFGRREVLIANLVAQRQGLLLEIEDYKRNAKIEEFKQKVSEFEHLGDLIKKNV